jgi:hypothetical protein
MILDKEIEIRVNSTTLKHYKEKGYVVKMGDIVKVKTIDLTRSSGYIINVKCDICGFEKKLSYNCYMNNSEKHNIYTCSNKCAMFKNKKTSLEKYGNENYNNLNKNKKTCIERYGVENIFQLDNIKEKSKTTNLEKYGFESHNKSEIVKEKKKKVSNQRIEKYKNSINNKKMIKYKEFGFISSQNNINKFKCTEDHFFEINDSLLSNRIISNTKLCTICNPIGRCKSGLEYLLSDFIKKNYNNLESNKRNIIPPNELDIYLPDLKIAFEFNGLFWHSELHKNINYHLNKTEECEKNDIKLIHIYEDDWIYKSEIVKSRILNLIGKTPNRIFGRKCIVKEVSDNSLVKEFLFNNHFQGFVGSQIKIGLFYNDELVSLMTFGSKRKFMKQSQSENVYEMLRFCNKLNTSVVGGADKLFKYFIKNYKPVEVTSYADRSWSQGDLYEKLGFVFIGKTPPNYYYIINGVRKHRFGFRKDLLIKQGFDTNKTEHQIMLDRGLYRIFDSGSLKYTWKI